MTSTAMFDLREWLEQTDADPPAAAAESELERSPLPDADVGHVEDRPSAVVDPLDAGFDLDTWLAEGVDDPPAFLHRESVPARPGWRTRVRAWSVSVPPLTGIAAALFLASIVVLATGFSVPGLVDDVGQGGPATPAPDGAGSPTPATPAESGSSAGSGGGSGPTGTDTPEQAAQPSTDERRSTPAAAQGAESTAQTTPSPAVAATPTATDTATPTDTQTPTPTATPTPTPGPLDTPTPTLVPEDDDGSGSIDETIQGVVQAVEETVGMVAGTIGGSEAPMTHGAPALP